MGQAAARMQVIHSPLLQNQIITLMAKADRGFEDRGNFRDFPMKLIDVSIQHLSKQLEPPTRQIDTCPAVAKDPCEGVVTLHASGGHQKSSSQQPPHTSTVAQHIDQRPCTRSAAPESDHTTLVNMSGADDDTTVTELRDMIQDLMDILDLIEGQGKVLEGLKARLEKTEIEMLEEKLRRVNSIFCLTDQTNGLWQQFLQYTNQQHGERRTVIERRASINRRNQDMKWWLKQLVQTNDLADLKPYAEALKDMRKGHRVANEYESHRLSGSAAKLIEDHSHWLEKHFRHRNEQEEVTPASDTSLKRRADTEPDEAPPHKKRPDSEVEIGPTVTHTSVTNPQAGRYAVASPLSLRFVSNNTP